jgi:hypothetical protein
LADWNVVPAPGNPDGATVIFTTAGWDDEAEFPLKATKGLRRETGRLNGCRVLGSRAAADSAQYIGPAQGIDRTDGYHTSRIFFANAYRLWIRLSTAGSTVVP